MSTIRICKKCNKGNTEKIEKAFEKEGIEVKYCCIKKCGKPLTGKFKGDVYKGESVKELVAKVVKN